MINDFEIESVTIAYGVPVGDAGAAQRINPNVNLAVANRVQIHHTREITHIRM